MKSKLPLLLAFLVSWDVSGFSIFQCNDPKMVDPTIGMCVAPLNLSRTVTVPKQADAKKVYDTLVASKSPAYHITNVHMYEEKSAAK